jgi:RNA recognition motif-containing protein
LANGTLPGAANHRTGLGRTSMKNLFVGNMTFQTTEADLKALFEPYGQVARVHIAIDRETRRSRGFGFVEMPNDAEAAQAMQALDGKDFGGRALKVNEARPREASAGGARGPRMAVRENAAVTAARAAAAAGEADFRTRTIASHRANRASLAGRELL